jgi:2,4-dienoyl-CoA reductase-like NADH-dependent reductase (Old Yellow Enzyme family)
VAPFAARLSSVRDVGKHRLVTDAVHAAGGRICLQLPPLRRGTIRRSVPHHPFQAMAAHRPGSPPNHSRFRAMCRARPVGRI